MIASLWAAFLRLPRGWHTFAAGISLAALLWLAWAIWLARHDAGIITKHEEKIDARIQAQSSAAAAAASAAVGQSRSGVERGNDAARAAAAGSDDPLRAGLDSLRTGTPSPRAPAR